MKKMNRGITVRHRFLFFRDNTYSKFSNGMYLWLMGLIIGSLLGIFCFSLEGQTAREEEIGFYVISIIICSWILYFIIRWRFHLFVYRVFVTDKFFPKHGFFWANSKIQKK
jgi:hypothetical protein